MTDAFWLVVAGVLGACVGSFVNVVVWRLPRTESLVRPPSRCPGCGKQIRWFDNLPILAWILLRGRCRACKMSISARYPLVEALTAALFVLVALRHPPAREPGVFGSIAALFSALVALSFIDLDTRLLPDAITKPGIVVGLVLSLLFPALHDPEFLPDFPNRHVASLLEGVAGMVAGGGLVWIVRVLGTLAFRKEAMGFGDVKLLAMIGTFLAPVEPLYVLLLASLVGSVLGGVFVYVRSRTSATLSGTVAGAPFAAARVRGARGKSLLRRARDASIEAAVTGPVPAAGSTVAVGFTIPKDDAWFDAPVAVAAEGTVEHVDDLGGGRTRVAVRLDRLSDAHAEAVATFGHARAAVPFGPFLAVAGAAVVLHGDAIATFVTRTWPEWVRTL